MNPSIPARMPYLKTEGSRGEPVRDMYTKYQYKIGQVGPRFENRWNMAHGRYLSGLGGENETQQPWAPEEHEGRGNDDHLRDLEKEDDVYGSGIFDAYGRPGTINPNLGCFADHPSLPGYVDREVLYHVHKDIADITNGADVIVVPPGGMTYQERGGRPVDYDGRPGPCRPDLRAPPFTGQDDVYVSLSPTPHGRPAPRLPPSRGPVFVPLPPARKPTPRMPSSRSPSGVPTTFSRVPFATRTREVPFDMNLDPTKQRTPIPPSEQVYSTPFSTVPQYPASRRVGSRSIVNTDVSPVSVSAPAAPSEVMARTQYSTVARTDISRLDQRGTAVPSPDLRGFGAATNPDGSPAVEDESPGMGTYIVAGLAVGAAAAMLYGATKMGGKSAVPNRRRRVRRMRRR